MIPKNIRAPIERFILTSNKVCYTLEHFSELHESKTISERREIKKDMYSRIENLLEYATQVQKKDLTGGENSAVSQVVSHLEVHLKNREILQKEAKHIQLKLLGKERERQSNIEYTK